MPLNNLHFLLSSTFSLILLNLLAFITTEYACPYPCNPPPIAGTITPTIPSTTPTGSYPPPTYSLPPSSGNYPNYSPPYRTFPNYPPGGNYGSAITPPPPDPILPYFPYYYRNGPRQPSDQSSLSMSSASFHRSTVYSILASISIVMLLFSPHL